MVEFEVVAGFATLNVALAAGNEHRGAQFGRNVPTEMGDGRDVAAFLDHRSEEGVAQQAARVLHTHRADAGDLAPFALDRVPTGEGGVVDHDVHVVFHAHGRCAVAEEHVGEDIGGVRVEHTRATYAANAVTLDAAGNASSILLNTQYNSYTNAFPTVHLRYEITPRFLARASLSSAIARPAFNQITAAVQLTPSSGSISQGNPQLQPTTGYNLDLGLERYFERGGVLSFGFFDKELRDYIKWFSYGNIDRNKCISACETRYWAAAP